MGSFMHEKIANKMIGLKKGNDTGSMAQRLYLHVKK